MRRVRRGARIAISVGCAVSAVRANDLRVSAVSLENVGPETADVQFDLSWSNSWRASWTDDGGKTYVTNWDAAWVFIKFRTAGGLWRHAYLAETGHTAPPGTTLTICGNGGAANVGALVYRSEEGHGPMACPNLRLRWNMAANGIGGTNLVDISVHAVEMVYIPGGPFWVGSGGDETAHFYTYPNPSAPYAITNEEAIEVGASPGKLCYDVHGDRGSPIPAAFPKGYAPFYCMKYEITQGQYTDHLNHLEPGLAAARFPNAYGQNGHTIAYNGTNYTCTEPDRACNFLDWSDVASCLDWSGLRPMTELEFEKVCRGPLAPVPREYVWGDTLATPLTGVAGTDGSGTETPLPATANCHVGNNPYGSKPTRAGLFARESSDRHASGAGYYGVMDLGGNVWEWVVHVGNPSGRAYAGTHGHGGNLYTFPATWPNGDGSGQRGGFGGHSAAEFSYARTSDRDRISWLPGRQFYTGGRGVRTAP